jgi:preprotein translocase subunit SecF
MRKRKFIGIGLILALTCIIIGTSLFLYNRFNEPIEAGGYNEKELKEVEQFSATLHRADLFMKIGEGLKEKGYESNVASAIFSPKRIELEILLTNKEPNEEIQKEVKQIANGIIEANKFDSDSFKISVKKSK